MAQRWRQPINDTERSPLFNGVRDNRMDHPAYRRRTALADVPPSLRIGLQVACSPIQPDQPGTSELRNALLRVLSRSTITDLVASLTHIDGLTWRSREGRGRHNQGAVLTNGDEEVPPPAWARVLLPDPTVSLLGRDSRCADFLLHIEPHTPGGKPIPPRDLAEWHRTFTGAFSVFETLTAQLLVRELRLTMSQEPTGKLAVWLDAPRDLTELVDISQYERVDGTHISSRFDGYAVADDSGVGPAALATQWLRQLCDSALCLDDYEKTLLTFGPT